MEFAFWLFVAYVVGSVTGFFIGRKMGIDIGSTLTFDLFVRLGYVKSTINADGEIQIERVCEGREPR
jgi:hypothetical protein